MEFMLFVTWFWDYWKDFKVTWKPYLTVLALLFGRKESRRSTNYIETCFGAIRVGLKWSFYPFRYDMKSPTIALKPYNRSLANFHLIMHLVLCALHVGIGVYWYATTGLGKGLDKAGKKELRWKKVVNFYYPSLAANSIPIILLCWKRADELKPLLTCPFHMELACIKEGAKGYVRRYLLGVAVFTFATCFNLPLAYSLVTFWRPCLPFLSISMLATDCATWESAGTDDLAAKFVMAFVEFWYWALLPAVYLGIGWIAIVYPCCAATRKVEIVHRQLKLGNESSITGFREVQVLGILTNKFWRFPLMQILLGEWLIATVMGMYAVVRLGGQIPPELFLVFLLVAADGCALIHVHFKLLAEPCLASLELFEYRKQMPGGGSQWVRRYVKSCAPFRLKMADGRFFDRTTALVVWQFVVEKLVMCLLL